MPVYLKIAALWGGQEGSLLFWCWLLSGFTFLALIRKWKRERELMPWVIVVTMFTQFFFLFLVLFFENPFHRYFITFSAKWLNPSSPRFQPSWRIPANGAGLNPLLRHFGMVVHPPMLYLGFVGFVIPFAYAIAALIEGRTDDHWIKDTRKWSLVAWLFPHSRAGSGQPLGLRCTWMGRLLGLGSGGNLCVHALVDRHRIPAFDDDAGKTRVVQTLEHRPDHPHLLPGHFRHFPHPFRNALFSARFLSIRHRSIFLCFHQRDVHRLTRVIAVSLEQPGQQVPDQFLFLARIHLPLQ